MLPTLANKNVYLFVCFIPSFPPFYFPLSSLPFLIPLLLLFLLSLFAAHRHLQQHITLLLSITIGKTCMHSFFLHSLSLPPLSLDGGRLGALAAQRGLQQQLHVKLASPHSLQCNSSLLRRGKVICL